MGLSPLCGKVQLTRFDSTRCQVHSSAAGSSMAIHTAEMMLLMQRISAAEIAKALGVRSEYPMRNYLLVLHRLQQRHRVGGGIAACTALQCAG